jgi:lysine 6-dehydrogenase
MHKIIVLGAGMVGSAIAIDLANKHFVTLTDHNPDRLEHIKEKCPDLVTVQLDVCEKINLQSAIKPFDIVISAVPGYLGFETLKSVIETGKNVIDISFFAENALDLEELARHKEVTAIVDCGVAPGMDNLILGYYNEKLKLSRFECLVGGLPKVKKWPFYYKAPFSPADVIEEYTRPARYVDNGKIVTCEPLTDSELVEFDKVGTLESFLTDGLRSILHTMPHISSMKEKTLRYPGHTDIIMALKKSGFFSQKEIEVDGNMVSPFNVTSKILFNEWNLGEDEEEITVMRITLKGRNGNGREEEVVCTLYDEYNLATHTSSMARTTGYTATAVANMFLEGLFTEKGLFPPELIGKYERCYNFIMNYLKERDIHYIVTSKVL